MKVKGYGDVFLAGKFNLKKILRFFSEFLIGVFIYSVRIFGGHPFSYAAASLGSLPLFLGCVFCAVFTGEDPVRITFALIAVFVIKKFVMPKFTFPEYVKVFISSLWGVLLAEILGAIIYNYTFYENFLFALSGIIGAVSSIAMEYAVSKENQKSRASNLYFISMIFFVSIVLCGMGASGRLLNNASIILTIFIILCLSSMSSLFYTASFSVKKGVTPPPSLMNIFKEINSDLGIKIPKIGELTYWAKQGVLLLNSVLTVRAGQAGSHRGHGWETYTTHVINKLNDREDPIVFLLWGSDARRKKEIITNPKHLILETVHPSPLSAHNGFFGCKHFSKCNEFLKNNGKKEIDWSLPE